MNPKDIFARMVSVLTKEEAWELQRKSSELDIWGMRGALWDRGRGIIPPAEVQVYTKAGLFIASSAPEGIQVEQVKEDDEYLASGGVGCPKCGSLDTIGDSQSWADGKIYQEMGCFDCGAEWEDIYQLIDYEMKGETPETQGPTG